MARNLPYRTHCVLLPLLSNCIPIFDELCRRSLKFVQSCLSHNSDLVRFVAQFCIAEGRNSSPCGRNALFFVCVGISAPRVIQFQIFLLTRLYVNMLKVVLTRLRSVTRSFCLSYSLRGRPGGRFQSAAGGVPVWASIDS